MNIQEVSDILGVCRFLRAPRYIFITDEPVYEEMIRNMSDKSRATVAQ